SANGGREYPAEEMTSPLRIGLFPPWNAMLLNDHTTSPLHPLAQFPPPKLKLKELTKNSDCGPALCPRLSTGWIVSTAVPPTLRPLKNHPENPAPTNSSALRIPMMTLLWNTLPALLNML